jgi:hypothetical protein
MESDLTIIISKLPQKRCIQRGGEREMKKDRWRYSRDGEREVEKERWRWKKRGGDTVDRCHNLL